MVRSATSRAVRPGSPQLLHTTFSAAGFHAPRTELVEPWRSREAAITGTAPCSGPGVDSVASSTLSPLRPV